MEGVTSEVRRSLKMVMMRAPGMSFYDVRHKAISLETEVLMGEVQTNSVYTRDGRSKPDQSDHQELVTMIKQLLGGKVKTNKRVGEIWEAEDHTAKKVKT